MVYKKYIKRGGKLFGPYYYRSVKKEGKVITQYVKNPEDFPQKKFLVNSKRDLTKFLIFPLIFLALILVFFLIKPVFTGKATFSVENAGISGETLSGDLKLNLEPNEFIPASTKVLIENGEEKYEFILRELIKESPESREFYVSGAEISGFGEGYGIVQGDLEVSFTMKILSEPKKEKSDEIDEQETNETSENAEREITEQVENENDSNIENSEKEIIETEISLAEETQNQNEMIEENLESETTSENAETEITGATILNFFNNIFLTITGKTSLENVNEIQGKVSKNKSFIYPLEDGQTAEIIESDKKVNLEIINNSVVVTTDYSGEGIEYLINLSELNIPVKDKSLEIKLIYNETEFYSLTKNLNIKNLNESNQIIQEINITDNSTIQYGAVLGEPVKWKKTITASEQNTIIELPAQAENISVYKIENQNVLLNSENLSSLTINEQKTGSFLTSSSSKEGSQTTGNLILEYSSDRKGFFSKIAKFITGRAIEITEKSEKIEVNISENGTEYEIEYTTPAPISFEKNTSSGKEVVISSEVHYENVLAYTSLPENTNLKEIKLYQIVDGLKIPVDFIAYNKNNEIIEESNDLDDDVLGEIEKIVNKKDEIENKSLIYGEESGDKLDYSVKKIRANEKENLVSYIEWIVPSLSNQTYEIILISKAEHLDSNRNFISDIYESVKSLDGNWSEQINDSEYVRVTFEKNLTNENDITIYPRIVSGNPKIEVYENNKTELIAEFTNITDNEYNKVYLTKLGQGNSYDNKTEILTEDGWKYFYELKDEKVATLNQKTNKLEWQLPSNKHFFDYGGEMYKIVLEDESELLVSPKHKVYVNEKKKDATNVASKVMHKVFRDYKKYKAHNYLNLSNYDKEVGEAPVASIVMHQSNKLSLSGHLGANPSWSASTFSKKDFSLQSITEVYDSVNNGNEIYFLNSNNEPIKVDLISKEKYNGKIYDVDVENDIILVKRKNSVAVWSGNSESYSQNIFDLKILGGSVEFDYIIDPIILGNANSLNTNTTYENNFTHLNVSNSSIVLYMPFDDNVSATTVYDYTENHNDGAFLGNTIYNTSQAIYGGAYTFDGSGDAINVSHDSLYNFERTNSFTTSFWVKFDFMNATAFHLLFKKDQNGVTLTSGWGVWKASTDEIELIFEGTDSTNRIRTTTTASNLVSDRWYHIATTYNGTSQARDVSIYINGIMQAITLTQNALSTSTQSDSQLTIGSSYVTSATSSLAGDMDEVMIWNTALNSTEVLAIYNNQTARFFPTGEMNYTGVNFAGNDTINITLAGCQQNMGTSLRAKVNDGAYVNFDSNCFIQDYNATGNLNSANVTVGFVSDANKFYTPLVIGNISLDSRDLIVPNLTINLPTNNTFSSFTNLSINYTAQSNDLSTCWYSNDTYTANTTLANCGNITTVQWSEGQHNLTIWVNDTANSVNSSRITFTIDTTFPTWSANETNLTSSTLNGKGVYFNITLSDTNPNIYIFSWYNGTAWENSSSSYTNNQEVSLTKTINIDVATINWTWYINDSANNLNQTPVWSVVLLADDNVPPNISFANPTTNATNLSQNFIFANLSFVDATSSISMANISLFNSTQNIINSTQGTISTLEINFTGLSDGTYYLNASVNDTLGNRNQTETRKIILDATAPNLTINSPTSGTYETSTILFNATSLDATTLVDSCWYTINSGTTNRTLSKAGTANNYNFTQTSVSDNAYTARFYCNDSANNVNNTQNVAFSVSTAVPVGGGPAPAPAVAGGGGGGGAPSKPEKKRIFNLGYSMYDQTISLKQVEFDKLEITNNGEVADEYTIEVKTIDNIISFEKKELHLEPGESQALEFKIVSPKEPGIYTGKIIVSNGVSEREVLVTINVKTEKSLFDITLTIPESMKTILFGQNLISKIDLIQMGLKENIDVTLNYVIKDFEGQTYLSESETIAVLDEKSYEKEFFTGNIPAGQYVLGTELIHPDGVAVASTHFVVEEKGVKFGKGEILLSALILVLIVISLVIFLSIRKYKKIGKMLKANR